MHRRKCWFSAPLFFACSTIHSFYTFAFLGACIEQRYQVLGRFGALFLSVLISDEKLSSQSVPLMPSKKSHLESSKSLKMRHLHGAVARDDNVVLVSSERPSQGTGGALKNRGAQRKKLKKDVSLLLIRWRQLSGRTWKASNFNGKSSKFD